MFINVCDSRFSEDAAGMVLLGGLRQRLRKMGDRDLSIVPHTPKRKREDVPSLSADTYLQSLYRRGAISSVSLREGSEAILNQSPESIQKLRSWSKAGTFGKHPSNTQRDIIRTIGKDSGMPNLYQARAKLWDPLAGVPREELIHLLLPHEMLDFRVDDPSEWLSFGEEQTGLEQNLHEWCSRTNQSPEGVAVMSVWGDAAPFNKRDSLMLILFNVMTGKHHRRFWICGLSKRTLCDCGCKGRCTLDIVWDVVAWSFGVLASGKYPTRRHDNTLFKDP
jgi:hypothetical protein